MSEDNQIADEGEGNLLDNVSESESQTIKELLKNQAQTRNFRNLSFWGAWVFASLFFISVICFSWRAVKSDAFQFRQPTLVEARGSISTKVGDNKLQRPVASKSESEIASKPSRQWAISHFLLLLTLLGAIGVTLSLAAMKYAFGSNDDSKTSDDIPVIPVISPGVKAFSEFISQVTSLLKSK